MLSDLLVSAGLLIAAIAWGMATAVKKRMALLEKNLSQQQKNLAELQRRLMAMTAERGSSPAPPASTVSSTHTAANKAIHAQLTTRTVTNIAGATETAPPPLPGLEASARPRSTPELAALSATQTPEHTARSTRRSTSLADATTNAPAATKPGFNPIALVTTWLTTGNVPVKVGMLVLFAGVAALLKYANELGWFTFPVWARLLGISIAAAGALFFGWRQRESRRSFALTIQGGSTGILLLTIFAAYRMYGYLPFGPAFALSLGLLILAVWLALRQNSMVLAAFALLGGFLAPIWLSTGSGNHVTLFSYYALLNLAVFGIALRRSWRILNLLGFAFTFGIATMWGVLQYSPSNYPSAQFFLALFFTIYLLIPILNATQQRLGKRDWVDGTLVFGTPLIAFSLQAALLDGQARPLALVAFGAAVLYGALSWRLWRSASARVLAEAYALLGMGFATLAVPLAFSAQATACIFALEGAALTWLGLRQKRMLPPWLGTLLHALSFLAFGLTGLQASSAWTAVANPLFMAAIVMAAAALATAFSHYRLGHHEQSKAQSSIYYIYALALLLGSGWREISLFAPANWQTAMHMLLLSALGLAAACVYRLAIPAYALALTAAGAGIWALVAHWMLEGNFWFSLGWTPVNLAILCYLLSSRAILLSLRQNARHPQLYESTNTGWWLHLATATTCWLWMWLESQGNSLQAILQGWSFIMVCAPALLLAVASILKPRILACGTETSIGLALLQKAAVAALALMALPGLWLAGQPAPLPWLPVFNPQDMVLLASLVLVARLWFKQGTADRQPLQWQLAGMLGFVWLSKSALAAVHHWAQVPWTFSALMDSALAQTTLTLLWGALGVGAWIYGSRRGSRAVWSFSMVIMGVVLLKLFVLDRSHLGNLWGIASFIGYGLLCVVVGYIAPSPPKNRHDSKQADD